MLKEKRTLLTLVGAALSAVTAVLYAVFYGAANTSMNSMSWPAFGVLLVGAAAALVLLFVLKRPDIGACVAAVCHLSAFMLAIYAFYPYISAAVVGIDSTWEVTFFVVMALFLAGLVVNDLAAMMGLPFKGLPVKIALPVCLFLFGAIMAGGVIANENAPQISSALKTPSCPRKLFRVILCPFCAVWPDDRYSSRLFHPLRPYALCAVWVGVWVKPVSEQNFSQPCVLQNRAHPDPQRQSQYCIVYGPEGNKRYRLNLRWWRAQHIHQERPNHLI